MRMRWSRRKILTSSSRSSAKRHRTDPSLEDAKGCTIVVVVVQDVSRSGRARALSLSLSLSLSRDVASRVAARARAYRVKATARELARRAAKAGVARVAVLRHGALFGSAGDAAFEDGLKRPSRRPNSWAQSRVSYS